MVKIASVTITDASALILYLKNPIQLSGSIESIKALDLTYTFLSYIAMLVAFAFMMKFILQFASGVSKNMSN